MVVTTTSTSGQHLKDDGEETDPIRLYFQSSISQQCAYVCSRSTSCLSPSMCRHPCYRLLRCRAVITKNMSRKSNSSFFNGRGHLFKTTLMVTTDLLSKSLFQMFFILFSDCYASASQTFMSLSVEHKVNSSHPCIWNLAPLTLPRFHDCLHFLSFQVQIHSFGLFCIQWQPNLTTFYLHIAQKLPSLPNFIRQKNNVISEIKVS